MKSIHFKASMVEYYALFFWAHHSQFEVKSVRFRKSQKKIFGHTNLLKQNKIEPQKHSRELHSSKKPLHKYYAFLEIYYHF